MVIVKNRTLLFANREQYLGTSYDNNSAVRMFQVPRISIDGVDIANLTFVANLKKSNGAKVSSYLEKEIRDEEIILVWEIKNEALNPAGTMFLNLRATDSSGTVRWSTYPAAVYAEGSIDAPEASGEAVIGFEQMVARSEELILELEESEGERAEAERLREEAEEERGSRAEELYIQLHEAIESADDAAAKANAAAGRLDEVGEAIDSANRAAAVAVRAAENANEAAVVANSASQIATDAKETAYEAKNKAENAGSTASEAKTDAENAGKIASEAKTAAGNNATEVAKLRKEVADQKDALTELDGRLSGTFENVDVLEKALTLTRGIYYFKNSCTNFPFNAGWHVIVSTRQNGETTKIVKLMAFSHDANEIYFNTYDGLSGDTWSGWTTHFMPLAGGTFDGGFFIKEEKNADGVAERYGRVWANHTDMGILHQRNSDKSAAFLCVGITEGDTGLTPNSLRLKFRNEPLNSWQDVVVYGEHSMPRMLYTGNGNSAARTMQVGGAIARDVLVITSSLGVALVTPVGGWYGWNNTSFSHFNSGVANYVNGVLTIGSTHSTLNQNGIVYDCRVV